MRWTDVVGDGGLLESVSSRWRVLCAVDRATVVLLPLSSGGAENCAEEELRT